jgi:hypothetical protein
MNMLALQGPPQADWRGDSNIRPESKREIAEDEAEHLSVAAPLSFWSAADSAATISLFGPYLLRAALGFFLNCGCTVTVLLSVYPNLRKSPSSLNQETGWTMTTPIKLYFSLI